MSVPKGYSLTAESGEKRCLSTPVGNVTFDRLVIWHETVGLKDDFGVHKMRTGRTVAVLWLGHKRFIGQAWDIYLSAKFLIVTGKNPEAGEKLRRSYPLEKVPGPKESLAKVAVGRAVYAWCVDNKHPVSKTKQKRVLHEGRENYVIDMRKGKPEHHLHLLLLDGQTWLLTEVPDDEPARSPVYVAVVPGELAAG